MIIAKTFDFDAAHSLPFLPEGHKCRRLHGHTYRVEISVKGDQLDEFGMLLDYAKIAEAWAPLDALLDHRNLNEVEDLATSTTENLAAWIFQRVFGPLVDSLEAAVDQDSIGVRVRVYESSTTYAEFGDF
jgi:6-pyruvoyltetrahydropterin/6-carboxytetrahydropterin synthase